MVSLGQQHVLLLHLLLAADVVALKPRVRVASRTPTRVPSTSPRRHAPSLAALTPDSTPDRTPTKLLPCGDALDRRIVALAVPAVLNFLILPITSSMDLYFIGKTGSALAVAGTSAANQVFSTAGLLTSVIPTITVPLVAKAHSSGDTEGVQRSIGSAIFLSVALSAVVVLLVGSRPERLLGLVGSDASLQWSLPYLRWRLLGVIPEGIATACFAGFRGTLNTVTPLQVSLAACLANCVLDPLLMFRPCHLGVAGAALATAASQVLSAILFVSLFLKRRLVRWSTILRPPSKELLGVLAAGGAAIQTRNVALNVAFLGITRAVQSMDRTGTAAAAHAVAISLWQLGGVVLFAIGTVATILTSAELGKQREAREPEQISESPRSVALRLVAWGGVLGGLLGAAQLAALPMLRLFTPLEEVRRAARAPSIIGSILQLINGVVFVGEGVMVGAGAFPSLAAGQVAATASFLLALRLAPPSLVSVWFCFWLFNGVRLASFVRYFWFGKGPLAKRGREEPESESGAHD